MNRYTKDLLDLSLSHAILVTGGVAPNPALLRRARAIFPQARLLSADAGADVCRKAEVVPDGIIGDMDSLSVPTRDWLEACGVPEVVYPAEKDDSDTALAVDALFAEGIEELLLLGALGGRMDHELANMMLLVGSGRAGRSIVCWDDRNRLRYVGRGSHHLDHMAGYIGIVPFSDEGMTLSIEGLYYPLDHYSVPFGRSRLVSNVFDDAKEAVITIERGDGILIRSSDRQEGLD